MGLFTKSRRRNLVMSAGVIAWTLGASAAYAQTRPITIQSQALASALHDFGAQTGRQIMFTPESTRSKVSGRVDGATDEQIDQIVTLAVELDDFNILSGGGLTKTEAFRIIRDMKGE